MKICVQNTRDESLVAVFDEPKKLKRWLLNRSLEALEHHSERYRKDCFQKFKVFLNKPLWHENTQNINTYLHVFDMPFFVSKYGGD